MAVKYKTILIDAPWPRIKALPVGDLAEADAHLWAWATSNYLDDAIDCGRAWGFRYIGCRPWVKAELRDVMVARGPTCDGGECLAAIPQNPGLGQCQYMRCDAEFLLLFARGQAMVPEFKPRQTIYAPRGRHSAKPACVYSDIERMSPGPRLEMFARARREGWAAWGNEVESDINVPTQEQERLPL